MTRPFYFDKGHSLELGTAKETLSTTAPTESRLVTEFEQQGTYTRCPPAFVDLDAALPHTAEVVQVCFAQLSQWHQSVELFEFPMAAVIGQGSVVTNQRRLIKESVLEFVAHERVPDGFVTKPDGTYASTIERGQIIKGSCLLAKRPWYKNYGHWLVDSLTVIALAAELIRINKWKIVIGKFPSAGMRRAVLDSIQMIFPDVDIEVLEHPDDEVWFFEKLLYVTPTHVPPLFKSPTALNKLRRFASSVEPKATGRRIFISRNTSSVRRLLNEDEIFHLLSEYDFELVHPETLPFEEQVRLFAEAEIIVGVKGAALTNCIFSPRGMKVMALCPADFPDMFFWDFIAQLDGHYAEVYGPITTNNHPSHNDFSVSIDSCRRAIVELLKL
jgi:capsular polysaccharide biosynthesis protein